MPERMLVKCFIALEECAVQHSNFSWNERNEIVKVNLIEHTSIILFKIEYLYYNYDYEKKRSVIA